MFDASVREQFVELRAAGKSFASIAEELGVSKPVLVDWSRQLREQVANLKQIRLEAIKEKYRMGEERRMELFSRQLSAVEGELAKRDLSELPTARLFDVLVKLSRELNTTDTPVTFQKRLTPAEFDFGDHEPVMTWQG